MRDPQPLYRGLKVGSLEDHGQVYQRRKSNEAQLGPYETTIQTARTSMSPQIPEQYRTYDSDSQMLQYRSSPGISIPQAYSPQPVVAPKRNMPQTSTPFKERHYHTHPRPVRDKRSNIPLRPHVDWVCSIRHHHLKEMPPHTARFQPMPRSLQTGAQSAAHYHE